MSYEYDTQILAERANQAGHEKIVLENKLAKLQKMYDDLVARFNTQQEMYWRLQDRHMAVQETLVSEVGIRNARDASQKPF